MSDVPDISDCSRSCPSPGADLKYEIGITLPNGPSQTPWFYRPDQTMIVFDWDDTLFPTSDLFCRWGLSANTCMDALMFEQKALVSEWEEVLCDLFRETVKFSNRCAIITLSKYPWVHQCLACFAPNLAKVLEELPLELNVVYAGDHLPCELSEEQQLLGEQLNSKGTLAKYLATKAEVTSFYSQYPQQTWKNVLSFGDMSWESDALKAIKQRRVAPSSKVETLRTKTVIFLTRPCIGHLTCRLKFTRVMLAALVRIDGDVHLDLRQGGDPLVAMSTALNLPKLKSDLFSDDGLKHALGSLGYADEDYFFEEESAEDDMIELVNAVYSTEPLKSFRSWFDSSQGPRPSPTRTSL
eukprot:TRINITY_DN19819_c0_g1_i1.p1 TRINITY_DN19819_c0_g1~~TRINITY_DN19819_c0_g1_i1.p1  ORF type:complete len:354 (+),score=49.44 TRINITY_DN19819_c0_g1_i1:50-1111(+)